MSLYNIYDYMLLIVAIYSDIYYILYCMYNIYAIYEYAT